MFFHALTFAGAMLKTSLGTLQMLMHEKTCMGAMLDSLATSCHEAWVLFIIDSKCMPSSPTVEGENGQVCYYKLFFFSC